MGSSSVGNRQGRLLREHCREGDGDNGFTTKERRRTETHEENELLLASICWSHRAKRGRRLRSSSFLRFEPVISVFLPRLGARSGRQPLSRIWALLTSPRRSKPGSSAPTRPGHPRHCPSASPSRTSPAPAERRDGRRRRALALRHGSAPRLAVHRELNLVGDREAAKDRRAAPAAAWRAPR